jgi:hypothetical protein
MKPRLGPFVRSLRPSQRRALGGLLAALILSLLYSGSYAVLRLNGYLVRGSSTDYGDGMYAGSGFHYDKSGAFYAEGSATMWGHDITDRTPLHTLRFFTPMIRIEMALRNAISRIR